MSSKSELTRLRILETTWKLLENGGAASVRMADIAKAVGISRQALYLHFPNRGELLVATARHLDAVHHVDDRLAASRGAATGADRLDAFVAAWGGYIPEIYGVAKAFLAMLDEDMEVRAAWEDRMAAVRHGCAAAVRRIAEDGALNHAFSEEEATDLLAALLSVRTWEQLTRDAGWTQARYVAAMQDAARAMLMPATPPKVR